MSLTSHLSNPRGPVRAWIDARFPDIAALVADSRRSLRDATTNLLLEIDPEHPALWRMVPSTGLGVQQAVDPLTRGLPPNPVSGFFARLATVRRSEP